MKRPTRMQAKLDTLTEKHRNLAARHEALFQTSKVMFALMASVPDLKKALLDAAADATSAYLKASGCDDVYQKAARAALDELRSVALAGQE